MTEMNVEFLMKSLGIKEVSEKTDEEFEKDGDNYGNAVDTLDTLENDLLTHYKELDVETYIKLRQLDLMKRIVDKLDSLEMIYDVYKQLQELNSK